MTPLPCPPEHWPAFSRRLDDLLALPADARSAALAGLPAEEALLRPWLAAVLAGLPAAQSADFLAAPTCRRAPDVAQHHAGQRVGPYALLRELGRGGMGVVWLARRADGAFAREVALKLPHAHLLVGAVRERFARERDILASLSHPHIARFYDAGLADDGQPYLALEAVHGQTLNDWCRSRALGLAERLALFDQVAAAVAHAHGKLVAHRDLKPAHVLVTADGQVKLLDFGIAKLLQGDGSSDGADGGLTRADGLLATPRYAAPEQLNGGPVSVATDVYALGLMLFELLTDQPAFADRHRGAPSDDTPQPSRRSTDPSLRHALAGDLDAIVGQALQPAPEARYASVAALADDLARHRRHQPISARRITRWAQAAKFVRRHRLPVALSAALGGVALVGVVGIAWQAQEARTQARRAESVKDFLLGVFNAADPRLAGGKPDGQTTAKTLLDRSAARIDERFAADPELRIELLRTAADIYRELGEDAAHDALRARQLALVRQHFGPLHDNLIDAPIEQALHAYQQGDMAACRARLAEADALIRRAGRERSEQRAQWWLADSQCHRDQPHQAARRLASLEKAEALFAQLAPGQRGHITAWSELAVEHSGQMRLPQALAANQRAIDMAERWPGRNEAELQTFHANRGITLQQGGDLAGAALALGRAADIAERTSGADFRTAWLLRSRQARTLHLSGDRAGAAPLFDALLARLPPPEKAVPDASTAREEIGERLAAEGRPQAGLPLLQAAERGFLQAANQEFDLRRARRHLGDALARLGRADEARQVFQLALQDFEAHEAAASTQPLAAMRERWGRFLLDQGETAAARAQWQRVLDEAAVPTWAHVALAQAGLARAALADGNTAAAQQFAHQSQATWDRLTGFRDVRMQAYLWRVQAHVLAHAGQPLAADGLRAQALAAARRTDAPDSPTLTQAGYLGL